MFATTLVSIIVLVLYFAPTIVAVARGHHGALGVFALNLLLGWTLLGWAGALVWVIAEEHEAPVRNDA